MAIKKLFGFFDFLKPSQKNKDAAQACFDTNTKTYWDATNSLDLNRIKTNSLDLFSKYEKLKEDPKIISRQKRNGIIIGIIGSLFFLFLLMFLTIVYNSSILLNLMLIGLISSWTYYFGIFIYYKKLSIDLIKAKIAIDNNWLYDPDYNKKKWQQLSKYFPEIFLKGNNFQYVEDQFWGIYVKNGKQTYFNSGRFLYTVKSNNGERNSSIYNNYYYIFTLPKQLQTRFNLYPENKRDKIEKFFSKKEINTESIEFNKIFAFSYNGKKDEKALQIVKTLSPAIQEELINLSKSKYDLNILFAHNTITFCFGGNLLENPKTDFQKSLKLADVDKKAIENQMDFLIEISTQMSKYLD